MDLLIFALVVCVVCGLVVYLTAYLPHPFGLIAKVVAVIIAILLIVQRAGLL